MAVPIEFEEQLIEGLQPIRQFAAAQVLFTFMDLGVLDALAAQPEDSDALGKRLGLDPHRLHESLRLLRNEGYVVEQDGWHLTGKGRRVRPLEPWYRLLVGSYAQTYRQLGDLLRDGSRFGTRDGACAGAGSCGISMYDALPLDIRLLDRLPAALTLVDIGAGDGGVLAELCRRRPELAGVAVEPDKPSMQLVHDRMKHEGMSDRVRAFPGTASEVHELDLPTDRAVCFLAAFSLQEMLEQEGDDAVRDMLRHSVARHPEAHWIVVEVDYRPDDDVLRHGLGLAYYSPYYLMHAITEQRLDTREFWCGLFADAGLDVVAQETTDPGADSTGLLMGFLLRARSGA